ncbi:uncharacterized protein [Anabrus simplex]|uniref:uncharacterized protein n=1 Tax=Anabrus simplex TaxID=316456 RepID=UPI0034DD3BBB
MQYVRTMNDDKKMWSRKETTELIQMYESSPWLWNMQHRNYRNRQHKNATLLKMAQHFETNTSEIQRKLHNLRNQLCQEMQKIKKKRTETGREDAYKSSWPHFEALQFILPAVCARQAAANLVSSQQIDADIQPSYQQLDGENDVEILPTPSVSVMEDPFPRKKPRREKLQKDDDEEDFINSALAFIKKLPDENDSFGEYVAMELKSLKTDFNRRRLKSEIRKAISKIADEELYGTSSESFQNQFGLPT